MHGYSVLDMHACRAWMLSKDTHTETQAGSRSAVLQPGLLQASLSFAPETARTRTLAPTYRHPHSRLLEAIVPRAQFTWTSPRV